MLKPRAAERTVVRRAWLSFAHFLDAVRPLSIQSSTEYQRRRNQGGLPPNLPSRPDIVYRDAGWTTWAEALGFERAARSDSEPVSLEKIKQTNCRAQNFESATTWFCNMLYASHSGEFELFRLVRRSRATLLFRKTHKTSHSQLQSDGWAALQVKSTHRSMLTAPNRKYKFRKVTFADDVGVAMMCPAHSKITILTPSEVLAAPGNPTQITLPDLESAENGTGAVLDKMNRLWKILPRRTIESWCDELGKQDTRMSLYQKVVRQATELLYKPAGLSYTPWFFPGSMCNAHLDDVPVLQRTAVSNFSHMCGRARLARKARLEDGAYRYVKYHVEDGVGLYCCFIHSSSELRGVFAFPRAYLLRRGFLGGINGGTVGGGRSWIPLFPPSRPPRRQHAKFAEEQQHYYIDLSIESDRAGAVDRFKEIFRAAKDELQD